MYYHRNQELLDLTAIIYDICIFAIVGITSTYR